MEIRTFILRSLQIRKIVEINSDSIDEVLRTAVKERIPAVSAAVVAHDKNIYEGHFGYSDLSKNSLVDEKSLFRIASMTKAITSACIFQLIDKKKFINILPRFCAITYRI